MKEFKKRILYVSAMLVSLCWSFAIFAQGTAPKVADNGSNVVIRDTVGKETLFEMILLGGWVMVPLGLCSYLIL